MKNISDDEIIDSIKRGNDKDFSLLIDRYKDRTFSLIDRILKNEFDSEEVLQDVFLKVYYSLKNFKGESKFSTWLYRISFNTALTKAKSKSRKIETEMQSIDDYEITINSEEIFKISDDRQHFVYKLLDRLPVRNSLVLILFYVDNLTMSEISEVLGVSIVNVKVMLHRSRNLLRDLLIKNDYLRVNYE